SCPSNRLAAVTKRSGEVSGWVWLSWLAGVPMARSGMISDETDCSVGGKVGLLGRHAAQADRTHGALRRAGKGRPAWAACRPGRPNARRAAQGRMEAAWRRGSLRNATL